MSDFVQIHNHTQYSKFDGFASVKDLVSTAKKFGMRAVGMTDHGTFAGAIDFLRECRKQEVRPILGMETYLSRDHNAHSKGEQPDGRRGNRHMNLIAKNYKGFQNVCALSQMASVDGFYYDPRVDGHLLEEYSEGVIATSACLSNVVNWHLSQDRYDEAKHCAGIFKEIYKDDYYLEAMFHGIESEGHILPYIQKLGKDLGIKIICTNDVHYINQADAEFHEHIMCISSGRCIKDPRRIKFPYGEFFFKSEEQMLKMFSHVRNYMRNTLEIADKCDYSDIVLGGKMLLPKFELPEGHDDPFVYLTHLAKEGIKRLGLQDSPKHIERLKIELGDLKLVWDTQAYDFSTYFLMVEDIMRFAKKKNIDAGIRGSGYGSLLCKCLGIVEGIIDPLEQGLLWERFLGFDDLAFISDDMDFVEVS